MAGKSRKASRDAAPARPEPLPADAPGVIVDFVFDRGLLHVAVINLGDQPAYRVSVDFEPPFHGLGGQQPTSRLPLFRRIEFLAPRKRIATFLDSSTAYFRRDEPTRITARIAWQDARGRRHARAIVHDLGIYRDVTYLPAPGASGPEPGAGGPPATP